VWQAIKDKKFSWDAARSLAALVALALDATSRSRLLQACLRGQLYKPRCFSSTAQGIRSRSLPRPVGLTSSSSLAVQQKLDQASLAEPLVTARASEIPRTCTAESEPHFQVAMGLAQEQVPEEQAESMTDRPGPSNLRPPIKHQPRWQARPGK
jgi:hypothetical protein